MRIEKIVYTRNFAKKLDKFSPKEKAKILGTVRLFWKDPFAISLKTHKLTGALKGYWAFAVSFRLRVLFRFSDENVVEFIDIGGHEIYK